MIPLNRNVQARLGDEFCIVRNFLNDGSIEVIWKGGEVFTCQLGDLNIDLFNLSELLEALDNELRRVWIQNNFKENQEFTNIQQIMEKSSLNIINFLVASGLTIKQSNLIYDFVLNPKHALGYKKMCLLCIDLVDLYRKMGE